MQPSPHFAVVVMCMHSVLIGGAAQHKLLTKLGKAYDGVLTITMDSGRHSFYEAFREAQNSFEIRSSIPPEQVQKRAKLYKKTI